MPPRDGTGRRSQEALADPDGLHRADVGFFKWVRAWVRHRRLRDRRGRSSAHRRSEVRVGVLVSASGEDGTGNSQLKCYALGALDTFGDLYDIRRIKLSIYQPSREIVDTFELSRGFADLGR